MSSKQEERDQALSWLDDVLANQSGDGNESNVAVYVIEAPEEAQAAEQGPSDANTSNVPDHNSEDDDVIEAESPAQSRFARIQALGSALVTKTVDYAGSLKNVRPFVSQKAEATKENVRNGMAVLYYKTGQVRVSRSGAYRPAGSVAKAAQIAKSMRDMGRDNMLYIGARLNNIRFNREESRQFLDPAKHERNQRLAWGAVFGVAAVYAATRFGFDSPLSIGNPLDHNENNGQGASTPTTPPETTPSDAPTPVQPEGDKPAPENDRGDNQRRAERQATLASGDTIWAEAENALGPNASVEDIDRVKDAILVNNGITEAQATQLPVGTHLKMPIELIEEIENNKKKK